MEQIGDFSGDRQKLWCMHCSGWLTGLVASRDHAPSKGFLLAPYPKNMPVVSICRACNESFSHDEEYMIAFMGAVLSGSVEPDRQSHPTAKRILARHQQLRRRVDNARTAYETPQGEIGVAWRPEQDRIDRVILKNARGHAFFELGEPLTGAPKHVWSAPLCILPEAQRNEFEDTCSEGLDVWPEVGSRMMTRLCTSQDLIGGWTVVQDGLYRYLVSQVDGVVVRTVLWDYLATEVYWEE